MRKVKAIASAFALIASAAFALTPAEKTQLQQDAATLTSRINALVPDVPPVVVPPVVTPPTTGALGWTKYAGVWGNNQSWYNLAWDTKRGVAWGVSWARTISKFDPVTGIGTDALVGTDHDFHNRTTVYDPINDRVWLTGGTGDAFPGLQYFDPNANAWTMSSAGGPSYQSAIFVDAAAKRLVAFGGWEGHWNEHVALFSLAPVGTAWTNANVPGGPVFTTDYTKFTMQRAFLDAKRNRIGYVDGDGSLWFLSLAPTMAWTHVAVPGVPPPHYTQYVLDVARDSIVGWSASSMVADGAVNVPPTQETWSLALATPSGWVKVATTGAVPPVTTYVGYSIVYDPVGQRTLLHTGQGSSSTTMQTWAWGATSATGPPTVPPTTTPPVTPPPPVSTTLGTITSFPLPALGKLAPFSTGSQSKHTNMATDGTRIHVSGGDWVGSATDGTWSMSIADGSWRQDVGDPVYPTLPAPHALQDGAGFDWSPSRKQFILWPGSYYAYDKPLDATVNPVLNYARGYWWLDPAASKYTQDTRLWYPAALNTGTSAGSPNGGIFDEHTGLVWTFGDSATDTQAHRWDVANGVKLADIKFTVPAVAGLPAAYFTQSKHVKIGREVYIVGYRTDGNNPSKKPLFLRWNLDAQTMSELAPPPVSGPSIVSLETRLAASHGKVVWPFMNQPNGDLFGIHVYDPATNTWASDFQIPTYGNFIGNSVVSLPDGRVGFSGGVFGKQQTHFWFYEAK